MNDDFWDEILEMLSELQKLFGETRTRPEDIDVIFDRDKHLIYITMPLRNISKIKEIAIENGKLVIWASNGQVVYRELNLHLPIKSVASYSLKNGVLDITLEY